MTSTTIMEETHEQDWNKIIKPTESLFRFNFRELWQYRDLIILFVKRDFVAAYKQTILGFLWHFIQPLFTTAVFILVGSFAKIPTDDLPRALFYITGIVIWNYFSSCLTKTSNTFIGNAPIFGKVYFPRLAVPISVIISNLMSFLIQFVVIIPFMIYYQKDVHPNIFLLAVPFIVFVIAMMGLGFGLMVSSLTIKYRDLVYFVAFGVQLGLYVTPVIYPMSMVPVKYRHIMSLNPISPVLEMFRYSLLGKGTFSVYSVAYSIIFSVIVLLIGILLFNKVERDFMDTV
jgi:lipopolysaccharide transport system permease protein